MTRLVSVRALTVALCALLVGTFSAEVRAQPADTAWTPALSMQYRAIGGTAVSPDGELVAYVVRTPLMEGEQSEYRSHIHVASADGTMNVQYTRGEHSAYDPQFSPDGQYLSFRSARSDETQVWAMRIEGGEAFPVTDAETGVGSFAWSPDGSTIAYTMTDPKSEEEQAREREKRDVQVVNEEFRFTHLYTTTFAEADDTTRQVQRLTGGSFHIRSFDWSPDGATIVFAHQPNSRINTGFTEADISTVPADSGAVTALVERPGVDDSPHYAPDGQTIAFLSQGGQPEPVGLNDVYTVSAAGGTPQKLAETPNRSSSLLGWTGDSQTVLISEPVRTSSHVFAVPTDGSAPQQITQGDGLHSDLSLAANAPRMAFAYENTDTPADVHLTTIGEYERHQLTDLHADVPKPPMGQTEVLTWTAPDGMEVEGLITYPVGYEDGDRVPLVLSVHGGPAGVYSRSFTGGPSIYMTQVFAQRGYAVLRPNPRGSTGYGKDFRYANVEDWGYGDYEDLMAGVDLMVDRGVAHPDSLALMGWSYGGYMTSFAVTRTDRFQAASMGAGLPNLISMVGTTDIPDYLVGHMGGEFWDNIETYERHSAIYRIDNVTTPTQVLHGAEDDRVPTRQGQEFYRALHRQGVPTEMVLYPRTPHGPREPKLLMDVTPRILAWFDEHLGRAASTASASTE
ncbi:MAG: prolyl oligopeptidase family serine peptidase [Bacteroidetes bacterium]|jgi:dipeptidyl aminopeptidase/acylaminoacyl peptidase|nr:prolyl oligopeptidase family serine peptidase [Bacteroidota bacterium]